MTFYRAEDGNSGAYRNGYDEGSNTKKVILTPEKFGELVRETEEIIERIEESLYVDPERLRQRIGPRRS